ncbi:MAG: transcription initiation protein [Opitutus sp.]|nr:transcription initiation protein [Opitutus sp.]
MSTDQKSLQYLLLFRHSQEGPDPTPEQMQEIMGRWMAWMKGMGARGEFAGANRLQETGCVLRAPGGANLTDGPFVEAKEIVGGYVLVNAPSLAAATAIARGCPGLEHGTIVEVREVLALPPM